MRSCRENGIKWVAFTVANDGITIVTSQQNTWATCLTTAELKKVWNTGSKVDNWKDVRPSFPDVPLKLFGPGTDSGTFDFFTEFINGKAKASRSDYTASEDDNILVQGVSGTRGGLGYFGLSYYEENKSRLNAVAVDAGAGCVNPTNKTVQNRSYKPLSRGLYIYAKRDSFKRAAVRWFIGFALNNQVKIANAADYVRSLRPRRSVRASTTPRSCARSASEGFRGRLQLVADSVPRVQERVVRCLPVDLVAQLPDEDVDGAVASGAGASPRSAASAPRASRPDRAPARARRAAGTPSASGSR